ncbi:MAG: AIPR family protein [Salinivirgaceae bacterium]|nr:AIPR family protein [Salinivirgaceae bacterium]
MTIEEYREEFLAQLRNDAHINGNLNQEQFVEEAVSLLEKNEELIDPVIFPCNMKSRNRNLGFHAYAYGGADSTIQLLITDFVDSPDAGTLTNEDIRILYNKMQYFIQDAAEGIISKAASDESDQIIDIANEFRQKIGKNMETTEITAFRFYIVTNKMLSSRVKNVDQEPILGRPSVLRVWTLERFYNNFRSSQSERIMIDCKEWGINGIQCLKAHISQSNQFDSYMGIVPGLLLAKLFKKYQGPLLEGNIRCFLNAKGKYNKAIKSTIIGETPERFFIYNNGISVVANSVKLSSDGHYITAFDGFQIVNGGQTTVSLCNAYIKGEAPEGNLEKIYVPMKLTVLNFKLNDTEDPELIQRNRDKYDDLVQQIARSSNWQNPTKEADFFSNDPFHREMERLSLLIENQTPPKPGQISGTFWFYERSAHRHEQQMFNMTTAKRKQWLELHPKNQVITKEKFGLYYNTLVLLPHSVCKGSVNNWDLFSSQIVTLKKTNPAAINSYFFRKMVAVKIIYDKTDRLINKADWYPAGGYKAMYVPYTIAKILATLPKGKEIDWKRIWHMQDIYPSLAHQLEIVAKQTMDFLQGVSKHGNERTYAVKEDTWKKYLAEPLTLTDDFIADAVDSSFEKEEAKTQERQARFNMVTDMWAKFMTLGADYINQVYKDMERLNLLSAQDRESVRNSASSVSKGNLTDRQVKTLTKIFEKLDKETDYIIPDK